MWHILFVICFPITIGVNVYSSVTISDVPYEKGSVFLWYLEELVGGLLKMKKFLRHLIEKHKFRAITSDDFKLTFLDFFKNTKRLEEIDWDTWFYKTGMPGKKVICLFQKCLLLV